jgi:hypothetical protein
MPFGSRTIFGGGSAWRLLLDMFPGREEVRWLLVVTIHVYAELQCGAVLGSRYENGANDDIIEFIAWWVAIEVAVVYLVRLGVFMKYCKRSKLQNRKQWVAMVARAALWCVPPFFLSTATILEAGKI